MPTFTTVKVRDAENTVINTFGGYRHKDKIKDGEFYDMTNLTGDYYPLLGSRKPRHTVQLRNMDDSISGASDCVFKDVLGMTADSEGGLFIICTVTDADGNIPAGYSEGPQLVYLNKLRHGDRFYSVFENFTYISYNQPLNFGAPLALSEDRKQLFLTGDKLYIFPDKISVSIKPRYAHLGSQSVLFVRTESLELSAGSDNVTLSPCDAEGNTYSGQTVSESAPASPTAGKLWVDISEGGIVWKKYSGTQWLELSDVYVLIEGLPGALTEAPWFYEGDGVELCTDSSQEEVLPLTGSHIVIKAESALNASLVITGLISQPVQVQSELTVKRSVPDLDYIVLAQNRLWGCRFADSAGGETLNEIYCSKLGDFKNWNVFEGISTDSYTASVGTPGPWTGAANVGGFPCFFKEDVLHKVYPSSGGAHQIVDKPCHGIQQNCGESAAMVGDVLYYKSKSGIMAYDGAGFENVGDALGEVRYTGASGGAVGDKYYISLKADEDNTLSDGPDTWSLFVYDTKTRLWHREDASQTEFFCKSSGDAFFLSEPQVFMISDYGMNNIPLEPQPGWEAVTGLQGYDYVGQKYISRFNMRMYLPAGSTADVFIEYDSSGIWKHEGHLKGVGTKSFVIPVRPRRCDHFRIKLSGKGEFKLFSFAKYYERGSDVT